MKSRHYLKFESLEGHVVPDGHGEGEGERGGGGGCETAGPVASVGVALADVGVVLLQDGLVAVLLLVHLPTAGADDALVAAHWKILHFE